MIAPSNVLGVAVVALGMALTPGPNMMYLVSRSITQGRRAGLISLGGIEIGFLFYLTLAAAGLSAFLAAVPELYVAVKIAGAGYLAWLAWKALRPGGTLMFRPVELPTDSSRKLFVMGLMTNLLNPKSAIIYASLIPQFVNVRAGHLFSQSLILGAVQILVSVLVHTTVVMTAGTVSVFLSRRPAWLRVQRYVTGTVLGLIAVKLATDKARPLPA